MRTPTKKNGKGVGGGEDLGYTSIRVPGKNGIYLVIIGLVWWGTVISAIGASPTSIPEWKVLVDEVYDALCDKPDVIRSEMQMEPPAKKRQRR